MVTCKMRTSRPEQDEGPHASISCHVKHFHNFPSEGGDISWPPQEAESMMGAGGRMEGEREHER